MEEIRQPLHRRVSVVVTDLDDTLFDWVGLWHACFSAMLEKVLQITTADKQRVLNDFRAVHQKHGTAEYAFSLEELPCLLEQEGSAAAIRDRYQPAIDAYRAARREHLKLYPTVLETLVALRGTGCLLVGYTESLAFYASYRIRRLGLDGVLDYLFSPQDHDLPEHLSADALRYYNRATYSFRHTVHHHTPKGEQKPSEKVLSKIISDVGASHDSVIYVGDKLQKDILMAQRTNVMDAHAAYGEAHQRHEYDLLKAVTHWTPEMVQAEAATTREEVMPTHSLDTFGDLLQLFCFTQFQGSIKRD